jgi:hypothetical protein
VVVDLIPLSRSGPVATSSEQGDEALGCVRGREFVDQLSDCKQHQCADEGGSVFTARGVSSCAPGCLPEEPKNLLKIYFF